MEDPDVADTVVRRRRVLDPASGIADDAADADLDADTRLRDREPAQSPLQASPRAAEQSSAHVETVAPEPASRPSLAQYRLSVNGGAPLPLDVAALVGRRPRAPRVPSDSGPRLVTVDSPHQEVSATHVEVRQQGTSVVVTDLRSTNGTIVTMPGTAAVRLRPGDSLVAAPGAIIDLGDGNSLEILPVQRLTHADVSGGRDSS